MMNKGRCNCISSNSADKSVTGQKKANIGGNKKEQLTCLANILWPIAKKRSDKHAENQT